MYLNLKVCVKSVPLLFFIDELPEAEIVEPLFQGSIAIAFH